MGVDFNKGFQAGLQSCQRQMEPTIDRLQELADALQAAIDRGGWDVSPCMTCGEAVVCLPDGMPMCELCAEREMEDK